ncbi:hypothetical protein HOU04_gp059 [Synechococcus phage S-T4]|jgi:hypothetical protein|uniref:Uncharacterized protein n=1 Tax=Synechococcus phage S-T4 TaxID=2268578 RepID=A0A385EHE0_9CAUD|nr:hypothetical protein HOU04_gp059 [Synechococcus phage S-T4]AXQ70458.1 hypothetical protein [Synechococcus phage S-T4]
MAKKLPPNPLQTEILQAVSSAKTKTEKINLLKEYRNPALVSLLIWNFDESIKSALPDGEVPYTVSDKPIGDGISRLISNQRMFYNFVEGGNIDLTRTRRESLFIELLESLHKDEAELLCLVKDKKIGKKYRITRNVVAEAYEDIVWGNRS